MPFMQDLFNVIPAIEGRDILLVVSLVCVALIGIYRDFKGFRFLIQPRYRLRAGIGVGLFIVALFVWWRQWVSNCTFIIALLLWVGILVLMIVSLKKIIWPFSFIFNRIRNYLKSGDDENAKKMLSCFRWLCIDPLMQYEWCQLCARTHLIKENPRKAYETLQSFDEKYLFEDERSVLKLTKAEYLVMLGNYVGALELISNLKMGEGDLILRRAHVSAICYEMRGDLAAATTTLISAISSFENPTSEVLPSIFNDLGQMRKLEGNHIEAFHYYEKAANSAVAIGNKHALHVSYQNLIESYTLEEDYATAEKWLTDYTTRIDTANVNDLQEFSNFMLRYYRQKSDRQKIIFTLDKGRSELYPKMTDHQKLAL